MKEIDPKQKYQLEAIVSAFELGVLLANNTVYSSSEEGDKVVRLSRRDEGNLQEILHAIYTKLLIHELMDSSFYHRVLLDKQGIFTNEEMHDINPEVIGSYVKKADILNLGTYEGNVGEVFEYFMNSVNKVKEDFGRYFKDYVRKWLGYRELFMQIENQEQGKKAV